MTFPGWTIGISDSFSGGNGNSSRLNRILISRSYLWWVYLIDFLASKFLSPHRSLDDMEQATDRRDDGADVSWFYNISFIFIAR